MLQFLTYKTLHISFISNHFSISQKNVKQKDIYLEHVSSFFQLSLDFFHGWNVFSQTIYLSGDKKFICNECGKRFSILNNLKSHVKSHDYLKGGDIQSSQGNYGTLPQPGYANFMNSPQVLIEQYLVR